MINAKEKFGYTKVIAYDDDEKKVLFAYCEAKSRLWQMFLGWRELRADGAVIFWIPTKAINALENILRVFKDA